MIIFEILNKFNLLKEDTINYLLKSINIAIDANIKEAIIMQVIQNLLKSLKKNIPIKNTLNF